MNAQTIDTSSWTWQDWAKPSSKSERKALTLSKERCREIRAAVAETGAAYDAYIRSGTRPKSNRRYTG